MILCHGLRTTQYSPVTGELCCPESVGCSSLIGLFVVVVFSHIYISVSQAVGVGQHSVLQVCAGQQVSWTHDFIPCELLFVVRLLFISGVFSGTGVPAGLFVPSLFCGACMGRVVGNVVYDLNERHRWVVEPVTGGMEPTSGNVRVLSKSCVEESV